MSLACVRMRSLMVTALAGRASDAERLELETHLGECARCRDEHAALEGVRRVRGWEPPHLSDTGRHRVLRASLDAAAAPAPAPRSRTPVYLGAFAGLAAAAALAFVLLRPPPSRIVDGDVAIVGVAGRAIPAHAELRAAAGGHVILDGPNVALAATTDVSWDLPARTVKLARGAVEVDVDPRQHKRFRVATARFVVEVLGTHFTVTPEGVRTARGKVRVSALDGTPIRVVAAGESWSLPPAAPPPVAPASPSPSSSSSAAPAAPPPVAPPPVAPLHAAALHGPDGERLAQARAALSSGDGERARGLLRGLAHGTGERAIEARALIAESFLVERRYDEAIDSYRALIHVAPRAPQAESALYAIPQLELEAGRRGAAQKGFTRYLAAYPHGRFAHEARDRLARLVPGE